MNDCTIPLFYAWPWMKMPSYVSFYLPISLNISESLFLHLCLVCFCHITVQQKRKDVQDDEAMARVSRICAKTGNAAAFMFPERHLLFSV